MYDYNRFDTRFCIEGEDSRDSARITIDVKWGLLTSRFAPLGNECDPVEEAHLKELFEKALRRFTKNATQDALRLVNYSNKEKYQYKDVYNFSMNQESTLAPSYQEVSFTVEFNHSDTGITLFEIINKSLNNICSGFKHYGIW